MSVDRPISIFDLPVSIAPEEPVHKPAVQQEDVGGDYVQEAPPQLEFSSHQQSCIVNPLFIDSTEGLSEEQYAGILSSVIESSKKESAEVNDAILNAILSVTCLDSDLFNRLLIDLCVVYDKSPLSIWSDTLPYLRSYLISDDEFVNWSLNLADAVEISGEYWLSKIIDNLNDDALKRPEIVMPIFERDCFDRFNARHKVVVSYFRDNHPDLFEQSLLRSPKFFEKIYEYAPNWITSELALKAVAKDGMLLQFIPQNLITDKLIKTAIKQNPQAIRFIREYGLKLNSLGAKYFGIFFEGISTFLVLKSDYIYVTNVQSYYKMALQIDGMAIGKLPEEARTDELLEMAKSQDPRAVVYTPGYFYEDLTEHKKYILDILKEDPSFYRLIPRDSPLSYDFDIMKLGLDDPISIPSILSHKYVSRGIALMAVVPDGLNLKHLVNTEFAADPEIIWAALSENPAAINYVHPSQRYRSAWYYLLENDPRTSHLTQIPHREITDGRIWSPEDYAKMMEERTAIETMLKENPGGTKHPSEPVALFIYPVSDHNGAYKLNSVHRMMKEGYKVAYYEVANKDEFISVLNHYLPMLKEGDVAFLGGHGTPDSLKLSEEGDEGMINTSDNFKLAQAIAKEDINEGVILVLVSCSNGSGGTDRYNMMMMMYNDVFRKMWHVYAMDRPDGGYPVIKNGELVTPGTIGSYVYHVSPDGEVETYRPLQNILSVAYYLAYDFIDAKVDWLTSDDDMLASL